MPHQWYVADTARTVRVTGHSALRVLPGQTYADLEIHLEDEQTRLVEVAASLARQARFHLPDADYVYAFDPSIGRVTIRREDQTALVLSLPVNQQGETPWIRVGAGDWTRITVDPDTLTVLEDSSLPGETSSGLGSVDVSHG